MMAAQNAMLRGTLRRDEPMARHVSWRAGGPARTFYVPADANDLAHFLAALPETEPLLFVGLGSNLLVRDGGWPGAIVALTGTLTELAIDGERVRAGAGLPCPQLARRTARAGLAGLEFLCGVPGTVGGALAMNAGALGSETWEFVESVETIDRRGRRRTRTPGDFTIGYRSVEGPQGEWFLGATFRLQPGDADESLEIIRANLARRGATQPTQLPNAGSVFRNPPGDYAARLIEACGLKGHCVGGACVSEKHANFIVNTGTATAGDIETLIAQVQATVAREQGVTLVREVRIVGEGGENHGH